MTHILVTHHHGDHVAHLDEMRKRYAAPVLAHALEGPRLPGGADGELAHGDVVESGDLRIEALHTPGHTDGMLSFVVNGAECFTGDTLFAGSVGGVRGATATSFEDLRSSIMDRLLKLDPRLRPQSRATSGTRPSRASGRRTRSCGSGADSTARARSRARRSASPRR